MARSYPSGKRKLKIVVHQRRSERTQKPLGTYDYALVDCETDETIDGVVKVTETYRGGKAVYVVQLIVDLKETERLRKEP